MKYPQTTHKQQNFIQKYVNSGDAVESARSVGYIHSSLPSLRAAASRSKLRLSSQISEELRFNITNSDPKALALVQNLALYSESEKVRLKAYTYFYLTDQDSSRLKDRRTAYISHKVE